MLRLLTIAGSALLLSTTTLAVPAITTFDPPGSVDTYVRGINAGGTVVGYYEDGSADWHGFTRSSAGIITLFDVPGAGTTPKNAGGTFAVSINDLGAVTGYFANSKYTHGFVRAPDGTITKFAEVIDAVPCGINNRGFIAGINYVDPLHSSVPEGIERFADGALIRFKFGDGIAPASINDHRVITGSYNIGTTFSGFIRAANGSITSFSAPSSPATFPTSINGSGTIAGNFYNSGETLTYGFVRSVGGAITTFNPAGATAVAVSGINGAGRIAGFYVDANGAEHGYVRTAAGIISKFDVPGAVGTEVYAINATGAVAGYSVDGNNAHHGFVRAAP